jgi:hypothetical protein
MERHVAPLISKIAIIQKGIFVVLIKKIARDPAASFGYLMVHWMDALLFGNKDVQVTVIVVSMVNAWEARAIVMIHGSRTPAPQPTCQRPSQPIYQLLSLPILQQLKRQPRHPPIS